MSTLHARQFTIGSAVRCSDGVCGQLRRVVIEPIGPVLTHLVVKPDHRERPSRLVPVGLVESANRRTNGEIVLRCSLGEFETLERAQETHFLSGASGHWGYRQEQMLTWPHYRLGRQAEPRTLAHEDTPLGDIHVRRGEHVRATDGSIGRVQGLVVDRVDHHVTHVLLDEGHIWGRKRAAIPVSAVVDLKDMTDGVRVNLTKDQVRNLPPVELDVQE
ncbi:MAG TPA: PRC-barrel domain-containing protein [Actinospica sp.]|nr:PRC-barrel domain-containing protein [Actinospica sp.]